MMNNEKVAALTLAMLDRLDYLETREAIRSGLQEVQEGKTVAALPALAELQKKLKKEFI
jgi:hypothetical protein